MVNGMVILQNLNLELPWNYWNFTSAYMYNTKEVKGMIFVHPGQQEYYSQ